MGEWGLNAIIAIAGAIGTYAILQYRVSKLEEALVKHAEKDDKLHEQETSSHSGIHDEFVKKFNAVFKVQDEMKKAITILERDTSTHLTMPKAEEKFVSKRELELQLKNIDMKTDHIDKSVTAMSGKLEDVLSALSIKSRTIKED